MRHTPIYEARPCFDLKLPHTLVLDKRRSFLGTKLSVKRLLSCTWPLVN